MDLFYLPHLTDTTSTVLFSPEESKHLSKVLRKKEGETVKCTHGKGVSFVVELTEVNPRKSKGVCIQSKKEPPLPYRLHMAVAPTKNNSRFEWFLEKATEIGISEITPIYCQHSERNQIKLERLEKILVAGMKQSQSFHLPILNPLTNYQDFILKNPGGYIAHCGPGNKKPLQEIYTTQPNINLLIGPEGDFSAEEIDLALQLNYKGVTLGPRRLRTETAAIVGCHTIALAWQ